MKRLVVGILAAASLVGLWQWSRVDSPVSGSYSRGVLRPELADPGDAPREVEPLSAPNTIPATPLTFAREETAQSDLASAVRVLPVRGIFGRVRQEGGEPVGRLKVRVSVIGGGVITAIPGSWTTEDGDYVRDLDLGSLVRVGRTEHSNALRERRAQLKSDRRKISSAEAGFEYSQTLREGGLVLAEPVVLEVSTETVEGFRASKRIELTSRVADSVRVDLFIHRRHDLEGDVFGENGPVGFADLVLLDDTNEVLATGRTDLSGRFRLPAPPAGWYRLHARKVGEGAAQVSGNSLGDSIRAPRHMIILAGGSTLKGLVRTPAGEPIPLLPITVISSPLAGEISPSYWPSVLELAQAEQTGGLAHSLSGTDEAGRFQVPALQYGSYMVRFDSLTNKYQPKGEFRTGGEHVFVFEGNLLTVHLEGESEDLRRAKVHCLGLNGTRKRPGGEAVHFVQPAPLGMAQFILDPGESWTVFAELEGKRTSVRYAFFHKGDYEKEIDLALNARGLRRPSAYAKRLPKPRGMAGLAVSVRGEKGKSLAALVTLWRQEGQQRVLVVDARELRAGAELSSLTPGLYEYLVESPPSGVSFLPIRGVGFETLTTGDTHQLRLEAEEGGRLQLEIAALEDREELRLGAHVIGSDNVSVALDFSIKGKSLAPLSTATPGTTVVCSPVLAPGKYRIEYSSSSSQVALPDQSFEIKGGGPTKLNVEWGALR